MVVTEQRERLNAQHIVLVAKRSMCHPCSQGAALATSKTPRKTSPISGLKTRQKSHGGNDHGELHVRRAVKCKCHDVILKTPSVAVFFHLQALEEDVLVQWGTLPAELLDGHLHLRILHAVIMPSSGSPTTATSIAGASAYLSLFIEGRGDLLAAGANGSPCEMKSKNSLREGEVLLTPPETCREV